MVLRAEAESLSVIHLFSSGIKKRFLIKLTSNLLLVLFKDLETLFPNITFFPVISQVLDIFQTYLQRAKLNYLDLIKKLFLVLNYRIYKEYCSLSSVIFEIKDCLSQSILIFLQTTISLDAIEIKQSPISVRLSLTLGPALPVVDIE